MAIAILKSSLSHLSLLILSLCIGVILFYSLGNRNVRGKGVSSEFLLQQASSLACGPAKAGTPNVYPMVPSLTFLSDRAIFTIAEVSGERRRFVR